MTTDPVRIRTGTSLASARAQMQRDEVGRLLVLDGDGQLAGVVARGDILESWPSRFQPLAPYEVRELMARVAVDEVMATEVVAVAPDATIAEAANLMFEHRVGALPVLRDGQVVGVLTCSDMLQGLVRILAHRD